MKFRTWSAVGFGALLLAVSSVLSRVLGVLRDYVFSKIFGIGEEGGIFALDAYYLAFRIPDLLYTLLILGALSAGFIPLYTRLKKKNEKEATEFASHALTSVFVLLLVLGGVLAFAAPWLVPLLAPGFDAGTQAVAVDLTRILLLSPLFMGLSGILQGVENVHKKFWGLALAPLFYNGSIILSAALFGRDYGVYALAVGVAVGAVLHFLVQLPGILKTPFRYQLGLPKWSTSLKEFFTLALPRMFGMSAAQLTLLVDFALASAMPLGAVSVYSYALNLQAFPYGVVAVSFSVAIFSTLAEQALDNNKPEFARTLQNSFRTIWFWAFPAVVGLFLLREPLIELILRGGAFDGEAALMTEKTFAILVWSALPLSLIPLWSRAFYALSRTKIPVVAALQTMIVNTTLSILFTQVYGMGVYGLAWANLISSSINALLLLIFLARILDLSLMKIVSLKMVVLSAVASGLMAVALLKIPTFNFPHVFVELLVFSAVGFLVYLLPFKFKVSHKS
ncbi:MAG: murein biosynthesis integral membrane protein MurJ [Patescibacteria group bacterium]